MLTPETLEAALAPLTASNAFCLAYSGGQDSHVLLHALAQLRKKNPHWQLRAIHINHGLSPHAVQWATHCQSVCDQLAIPLVIKVIKLTLAAGDSVEAVARAARYQLFQTLLNPTENLLTAHNLDDQSETFLLQLMRGAGVKGLSAMPSKKIFAAGFLLRPLLTFSRADINAYGKKHDLHWIEDESNLSLRFNRNFLRHEIIPLLQQRWPQLLTTVSRSAQHCAEAAELLDTLAKIDLANTQNQILAIDPLLRLSKARQRNVLRRWIHRQGYLLPNTKHLDEILIHVAQAQASAAPLFAWDCAEIRRYQNHLYLLSPMTAHEVTAVIAWDFQKALILPDHLGTLQVAYKKGEGIIATIDPQKITVRFRQGGERMRLPGRKQTHTLKHLMQMWQIPPWQRDRVPLIFFEDQLIAVVNYGISADYAATAANLGIIITNKSNSSSVHDNFLI